MTRNATLPFMYDYYIFDDSELERIGIVCPECSTESVFDLTKDQTANQDKYCPGCGSARFLPSFATEAKQRYNFVTYYKRGLDMRKDPQIRFYFKRTSPSSHSPIKENFYDQQDRTKPPRDQANKIIAVSAD